MQEQLVFPIRRTKAFKKKQHTVLAQNKDAGAPPQERDKALTFLRDYDLKAQYGPCIGITRRERMTRAEKIHDVDRGYLRQVRVYLDAYGEGDSEIAEQLWNNVNPKP